MGRFSHFPCVNGHPRGPGAQNALNYENAGVQSIPNPWVQSRPWAECAKTTPPRDSRGEFGPSSAQANVFGHFASLHGAAGRNFLPPFAKSEMKPDEPMARACANTWVRMPMHAGAVHAFVCAPQARRAIFGTREQQLRPMVARRRRARRFLAPTHACGAQRRRFFLGCSVLLARFLSSFS